MGRTYENWLLVGMSAREEPRMTQQVSIVKQWVQNGKWAA